MILVCRDCLSYPKSDGRAFVRPRPHAEEARVAAVSKYEGRYARCFLSGARGEQNPSIAWRQKSVSEL
jgi:hypothetical protein